MDTVDEPPPLTTTSELFPANRVTTAKSSVEHVTVPAKAVCCDSCGQNVRLGDTSKTPVSPFSDTVSGAVSDVARATEPAVTTTPPADRRIGRVDGDADTAADCDAELDNEELGVCDGDADDVNIGETEDDTVSDGDIELDLDNVALSVGDELAVWVQDAENVAVAVPDTDKDGLPLTVWDVDSDSTAVPVIDNDVVTVSVIDADDDSNEENVAVNDAPGELD